MKKIVFLLVTLLIISCAGKISPHRQSILKIEPTYKSNVSIEDKRSLESKQHQKYGYIFFSQKLGDVNFSPNLFEYLKYRFALYTKNDSKQYKIELHNLSVFDILRSKRRTGIPGSPTESDFIYIEASGLLNGNRFVVQSQSPYRAPVFKSVLDDVNFKVALEKAIDSIVSQVVDATI